MFIAMSKIKPFGVLKVSKRHGIARIPKYILRELSPPEEDRSYVIGWEPDARVILLFNPEMTKEEILKSLEILKQHIAHKFEEGDS